MACGARFQNDRYLARLLVILGLVDLLALLATIMPLDWMAWVHVTCDLGPFPNSRITGYLARSTSALYALHGALLIFISMDVDRYRPLIRFLAWATIWHGAVLLGIDLSQGMPVYWTFLEAPGFTLTGIVMLWFLRVDNSSPEIPNQEVQLDRMIETSDTTARSENLV